MKRKITEYFYFTKSERNGTIILFLVLFLLLLFPSILPFFENEEKTDFSAFKNEMAETINEAVEIPEAKPISENEAKKETAYLFDFDPNLASEEELNLLGFDKKTAKTLIKFRSAGKRFEQPEDLKSVYGLKNSLFEKLQPFIKISEKPKKEFTNIKKPKPIEIAPDLFNFDPNVADEEELSYLGLSQKVVQTVINYRNKGATFRKADDFAKIYGLSSEQFEKLRPYIQIKNNTPTKRPQVQVSEQASVETPPKKTNKDFTIDINTATVEDWQELSGIGPYYSKKIVNFRDKLGGFHSVDQVSETYRLPDSTFQKIRPFLKSSPINKKLDINSATIEELKAHPYIDYKKASLIYNYRIQHGPYKTAEDLKKIKVFSTDFINKIHPYLMFNESHIE